jgi:hypothetical protein
VPSDDEILKAAKGLLGKLGSAARDAGKAAKRAGQQVTGIGRGTARVALDRTRFVPGDDIKGTITLTLPEPVEAKSLTVTLRAIQRSVDVQKSGTVYEQKLDVGGPKKYESGEVAFSLPIPKDATSRRAPVPAGPLGDVARVVSAVVAPGSGPLQWRVTVALVIPWGRDIDHDVDIVVD